ncbi:MAG: bifunctional (p)ppGpp synthetase/guanosine-3',5'-bis(diphosphate) 3'-pyrophosphohydrolase [Gammaproteobacteria bacterium]|nr:bifunctional (p)ppGpp synthetase/guanosine-3',5'-bis(diphosphate) 3'-pyrophosphohydrolase [Gammaproteobacteria bacterium]
MTRLTTAEAPRKPGSRRDSKVLRELRECLQSYLPADQIELINKAIAVGTEAHSGQFRKSGEPYIEHPIAVALLLAELRLDHECLCAAILHDTIEDTPISFAQLKNLFNENIAYLVDGVTKLDQVKFRTRQEATAESFRKMILAMVNDLRVLLIKLADRLHNMRTLGAMAPAAKRRIARETLEIYAPLAGRLGLQKFREELEDLGFRHMHPRRYEVISRRARSLYGDQRSQIRKHTALLGKAMQEHGIKSDIKSRCKAPYSIYRKMVDKNLSLDEVADIIALRVITDTLGKCYMALGAAHQLYQPIPGRFKDYIALPKPNGYQSLHTIVKTEDNTTLEIQIRTEDMNEIAEHGQAAHWAYKYEQDKPDRTARVRGWFTQLFDPAREDTNSLQLLDSIKSELYPDQIFVFTPKGRIIDLRKGSTALDFAYAIHTEIGNRAWGCKVDNLTVPLSYELVSGETVEIETRADSKPKPQWLHIVNSSKARAAIRHSLRELDLTDSARLGHRMLEKALAAYNCALEDVPKRRLQRYLRRHNLDRIEDLLIKLAHGDMLANIAAAKLLPLLQRRDGEQAQDSQEALTITGDEGTAMVISNCCYPIPGDRIIGYVHSGSGIAIHRRECKLGQSLCQKHPERQISVDWAQAMTRSFHSLLRLYCINGSGVLASISQSIGRADTNIVHIEQPAGEENSATLMFLLSVRNRDHLARVIKRLHHNPYVVRVEREMRLPGSMKTEPPASSEDALTAADVSN